jgi:hypothetical protein
MIVAYCGYLWSGIGAVIFETGILASLTAFSVTELDTEGVRFG